MLPNMRCKKIRILIISGASGGHFFTSLAYIQHLKKKFEIYFIINNEVFSKYLKEEKIKFSKIYPSKFRYSPPSQFCISILLLILSMVRTLFIILKIRPHIIIGFGSYICSVSIWSKILGIPLIIHEQNVIYGQANKLLSRFADCICIQKWTHSLYPEKEVICPLIVREQFRQFSLSKEEAKRRLGFNSSLPLILFMGGSKGAVQINKIFMDIYPLFEEEKYQFIIISGEYYFGAIKSILKRNARVFRFYKNIWEILRASDIMVARAGILSIYEALYEGVFPILVPLFSAHKHQFQNARYFSREGLSKMFVANKNNVNSLVSFIKDFLKDGKSEDFYLKRKKILSSQGPLILEKVCFKFAR